jgi:hypothetical protein
MFASLLILLPVPLALTMVVAAFALVQADMARQPDRAARRF